MQTDCYGVLSLAKKMVAKDSMGTTAMQIDLGKLYTGIQNLMAREEGQDLIEYALVVALIAFAATVGMNTLASDINSAFTTIGTKLTNAIA